MSSVFESDGFAVDDVHYPALVLGAGEVAGWHTSGHTSSATVMDLVLGLRPPPPRAAVWFGGDVAAMDAPHILGILRRLAPLTSGGGLIGNLNLGDNIMLPASVRRPRSTAASIAALEHALDRAPWSAWLPGDRLTRLPFQSSALDRFLAGVIRAFVAKPEAVVACHPMHLLERSARPTAAAALAWLREALPGCAWLFLEPESPLPAGFGGNILEPAR